MKNAIVFSVSLLLYTGLNAQYFSNNNLNSMVQAEFDFAKMSKDLNTCAAFLHFCNNESIGFHNGPNLMRKYWEQRKADSSLLFWKPDFADISSAGDLGFDAGPWQYFNSRKDTSPSGTGHFITLWKRDSLNFWKVALDIGISYYGHQDLKILETAVKLTDKPLSGEKPIENIVDLNSNIEAQSTSNQNIKQSAYFNRKIRLYYNENPPVIGSDSVKKFFDSKKCHVDYKNAGSIISVSNDLCAFYGSATLTENVTSRQASYIRFWKKENGQYWKIAMLVIVAN